MTDSKPGTRQLGTPQDPEPPKASVPVAAPPAEKEAPKPRPTHEPCPHCGYNNRVGTLICDNCKRPTVKQAVEGVSTKSFEENDAKKGTGALAADAQPANRPMSVTNLIAAVKSAGTDIFEPDMVLRFEIEGSPQPIVFYPKPETHIGRRDPMTGITPEIDLTAFAGYRMGVSRDHCVLRLKEKRLELTDLGSSNGTQLNGQRLTPHAVHILRDGDELTLGKMMVRVIFQKRKTN